MFAVGSPHLFVFVKSDVVSVVHVEKAMTPFLVLFQVLVETSRKDALVLQWVLRQDES